MLTANQVNSIYADYVNQAAAEKLQRVNECAESIAAAAAARAAAGQRAYFVKADDIQPGMIHAVKDALRAAGFIVKTRLINGYQKIEVRF